MGCGDEKLSKYLTPIFTAHCNAMICQQVTLSGDAEWPKVAGAVIKAGHSILNPYKDYLLERWNAGCRIAIQLFRELQSRGYTGSYRRVAASASRLRQAQGLPPRRQGRRQTLPVVAEPACQPLTPRRATWLVLGREEKRTEAEAQQLTQLHAQDPQVAEAIDLAQDFTQMVRQRQPAQLDPWLQRATASTLEALQRFA